MTSRAPRGGFTLIEVMAGVLVLGLLYTVLASSAMRGLRSEGTDRRRAGAEMIADRELTELELELAAGSEDVRDGTTQRDEEPYKVIVDVEPADVLAMLPRDLREDIARTTDPKAPSVFHDERGRSRMRQVSVTVEWDEAGEADGVTRTTFALDTSGLEALIPAEEGAGSAGRAGAAPGSDPLDQLRKDAPPELRSLIPGPTQGRGR
ncbi:MAG TPA: type II secretion system protein [Myxococcota bacterium]|nr:type II secretion system protein [Myxococcota bacterium]